MQEVHITVFTLQPFFIHIWIGNHVTDIHLEREKKKKKTNSNTAAMRDSAEVSLDSCFHAEGQ